MALREILLPWTEQPQERVSVNPSYTEGLLSLVLPNGSNLPLSVHGQPWVAEGSLASTSLDSGGLGVETNGDGSTAWNTLITQLPFTTEFTAIVRFRKTDTTNRTRSLFGIADGTNRINVHAPWSDGTTYFDYGGASSGTTRVTAAGLNFQQPTTLLFSAGPRGMSIWQDGLKRSSHNTPAWRSNGTTFHLMYGVGATTGSSDLTRTYLVGFWNKAFTEDTNYSLSSNPWQLFEPRRTLFQVPASFISPAPYWRRRDLIRNWDTQPQEASDINWSNSITRGLITAKNYVDDSSTLSLPIGQVLSKASSKFVASSAGLGLAPDAGTTIHQIETAPFAGGGDSITFMAILERNTNSFSDAAGASIVNFFAPGWINGGYSLGLGYSSYQNRQRIGFACGLPYQDPAGLVHDNVLSSPQPQVIIARCRRSQLFDLWVNNEVITGTPPNNFDASAVHGGEMWSGSGGSNNANGSNVAWAIWNRAISDEERRALTANPWQIFAPQRVHIRYPVPYTPVPYVKRRVLPQGWCNWAEQPQESVSIDWNNPITDKLVFAVNYGAAQRDIVYGIPATTEYAPLLTPTTGAGGIGGLAPDGTYNVDKYIPTIATGHNVTSLCLFLHSIRTASNPFSRWNTNTNPTRHWFFSTEQDTNKPAFGVDNTAGASFVTLHQNSTSASTPSLVIGRYDNTTKLIDIWFNGIKGNAPGTLTGTENVAAPANTSTDPFAVGNRYPNFGIRTPGPIYLVASWDRALSDQEIEALSVNPWQLFESRQVPVFNSLPLLTDSTYKPGTLTFSGWTPRVTAS